MSKIYQWVKMVVSGPVRKAITFPVTKVVSVLCLPVIAEPVTKIIAGPVAKVISDSPTKVIPEPTTKVIPEGCSRESLPCETAKRPRVPTETLVHPNGHIKQVFVAGFTLIELLVVVLIIGILAAVALPQYQTAVAKTHFTQLITATRSLYQAQLAYKLENGDWAHSLEELPYQVAGEDRGSFLVGKDFMCEIGITSSNNAVSQLSCSMRPRGYGYAIFTGNGRAGCIVYDRNKTGERLCRSLQGNDEDEMRIIYVD